MIAFLKNNFALMDFVNFIDFSEQGGGVMIYVRNYTLSKQSTKNNIDGEIDGLFVKINLRKTKWLLYGTYHPPSQNKSLYIDSVSSALDTYLSQYDKLFLVGDFNCETFDPTLKGFLDQYSLKNIVKEPTCFKSVTNPSCIDLILTNNSYCFENTIAVSTGLSDFHKMLLTTFK